MARQLTLLLLAALVGCATAGEPAAEWTESIDVAFVFGNELLDIEERCDFFGEYRQGLVDRLTHPRPDGTMETLVLMDRANLELLGTYARSCYDDILEDPELLGRDRARHLRTLREVGVLSGLIAQAWAAADRAGDPEAAARVLRQSLLVRPDPLPPGTSLAELRAQLQAAATGEDPRIVVDERVAAKLRPEAVRGALAGAAAAGDDRWGMIGSGFVFQQRIDELGTIAVRCTRDADAGPYHVVVHPVVIQLVPKAEP
jgi:hypothetical protein